MVKLAGTCHPGFATLGKNIYTTAQRSLKEASRGSLEFDYSNCNKLRD
jgi:hypothetical protein